MMNSPSMFSVEQLLKARQDGVPDYVVVPMLQKAMAERQAAAQQQALQQGMNQPPPVAQQILGAAQNSVIQDHLARRAREEQPEARGIDSLRSGIDESDYAGGGIVAFSGKDRSDVPSEFYEEEEGLRLPAVRGNNYFNSRSLDGGEGWAEFEAPEDSFRQFAHQLSLYKQRGIKTPDKFINTYSPKKENDTKRLMSNITKWTGLEPDQEVDLENPEVVSKLAHATLRNERSLNLPESEIRKLISKGYSKRGEDVPTSQGIASLPEAQSSIAYPQAPEDMPMPHSKEEESAAYKAQQLQDLLGEDPNAAAREARLSKREADIQSEKDRSPWLALMQAGLATMAGTSPNALTNIGTGAMEGLKSYGESRKDLSKSEEKLMDLRDEVEAAQRAEQKAIKLKGFESAEAAKAANIKTDVENKLRRYEHGIKGAEYGQKERELQATSSLRDAQAEEARAKAKYYGADGAGSKGSMTANQLVNTLKYQDAKYTKQIAALEKDDRLSDEEKQHEIDVRKDRQAKIADIMENIMVGNPIDHAEVLKLNEPFPAYKAPPKKEEPGFMTKLRHPIDAWNGTLPGQSPSAVQLPVNPKTGNFVYTR